MVGYNMPPGVSPSDIPGNDPDDRARSLIMAASPIPVPMTVAVDREAVSDFACTAFEGGINYWSGPIHVAEQMWMMVGKPRYASEVLGLGGEVWVPEYGELDYFQPTVFHRLTDKMIAKAIVTVAERRKESLENFIEYYDAVDADTVIQIALFGEVVYG